MSKRPATPFLPAEIRKWRGDVHEVLIGEGTFGRVYKKNFKKVVKKIPKTRDFSSYVGEVIALEFCHTSLIKILGINVNAEAIHVHMKFGGEYTIEELFRAQTYLKLKSIICIASCLASGLTYMHCLNYVHRDINPSNVVWDTKRQQARIIDFGSTRPVGTWASILGDPTYRAPELQYVAHNYHKVDIKVDSWSCGIFYLELSKKTVDFCNNFMSNFFYKECRQLLITDALLRGTLCGVAGRISNLSPV